MNFINSYIKKISKKIIFLSTVLMVLMAVGIMLIFVVNGFKLPHASMEDILILLIFAFLLPTIVGGIGVGLSTSKMYYQINKYLRESSKEKQRELHMLLKKESSDKEVRWHMQPRYSEHFMILIPDTIIEWDEISSCKRFGTKRYHKGGTYYQVKFMLKSGKKRVIDFSTTKGVDATLRWWQQK